MARAAWSWRGRSFDDLWPLLNQALLETIRELDDVSDAQVVYVGFSPARESFVVAWDLWLRSDDEEGVMAVQVLEAKFVHGWLGERVKLTRSERHPAGFYGATEDAERQRSGELVDLLLD
jgi:hypothetical protein